MNKKLTPLEALEQLRQCFVYNSHLFDNELLTIIENALKNYLELVDRTYTIMTRTQGHKQAIIDMICKNYKEVKIINLEDEMKLKALELIKETLQIDKDDFYYSKELDKYFFIGIVVSKEKYDLLKEVLKC